MPEEGAPPERRFELVRDRLTPRLRFVRPLPPRTLVWILGVIMAAGVVAWLRLVGSMIEGRDGTMLLTGHVMADGLVRGAIVVPALGFLLLALGVVPVVGKFRTLWDAMIVDDDGITVSRRGRTRHATWPEVRSIDLRGRRGRSGLLRARGFVVELGSMHPPDRPIRRTRLPPRLAETEGFRELITTRGVPIRRRWLRWTDSLAIVLILFAALPHVAIDRDAGRDYRTFASHEATPAEKLAACDALLARRPDNGFARIIRAEDLASLGRMTEARADADRAVADDPGCGFTWDTRKWIADASGDPAWALTSWMQAHPGLTSFERDRTATSDQVVQWRAQVGRHLFMTADFDRARRWFVAAGRDAAGAKDPESLRRRLGGLLALCDVAQARPEHALASLATMDQDSPLHRHVEALALRCLGREEEMDAVLMRDVPERKPSQRFQAANETIERWLRDAAVELPSSLSRRGANADLAMFDAPLLDLALHHCQAAPP